MHVLVTGAGGFVGRALVQRLLKDDAALPRPLTSLTAVDQHFGASAAAWLADTRCVAIEQDFADPVLWSAIPVPDLVFHLASVPGSLAEHDAELGVEVNLMASIALLRRLVHLGLGGTPPRLVFASSVAVYGALPTDGPLDDTALPQPALSYGAHKLMTEVLLADLSRRGELDGVSLRLPGIVARPVSPTGHGSAFMSDLIRHLCAGRPYACPVSAGARIWWMSLPCCIDNLLHAAHLPSERLPPGRAVQLPVITATVAEVVRTIEQQTGQSAEVIWNPDARIESLFGRMPLLLTPKARQLGFMDDGSLSRLVLRALAQDADGGGALVPDGVHAAR